MTVWGPGNESRRDDATIPLPARDLPVPAVAGPIADSATVGRGYDPADAYGRAGYDRAGYDRPPGRPDAAAPRRRRARRLLLWATGVAASLVVLAVMAFGALLLATPSVGDAPALVRAQDLAH